MPYYNPFALYRKLTIQYWTKQYKINILPIGFKLTKDVGAILKSSQYGAISANNDKTIQIIDLYKMMMHLVCLFDTRKCNCRTKCTYNWTGIPDSRAHNNYQSHKNNITSLISAMLNLICAIMSVCTKRSSIFCKAHHNITYENIGLHIGKRLFRSKNSESIYTLISWVYPCESVHWRFVTGRGFNNAARWR